MKIIKNVRRIVALLLAVCIALSVVIPSVYAETSTIWTTADPTNVTIEGNDVAIAKVAFPERTAYTEANDYDNEVIEFDLTLKEGSAGFFSFRSEDSSKVPWDAYAMDYLQIGGEAIFVVNRYHNGTEWTTETAGVAFNFADGQSHHIELEMDNEAKTITLTVDGTTTTTLTCSGSWRTTGGMSIVGNQTGLELKNLKLTDKTPWTTADPTNVTIEGNDVAIAKVAFPERTAYTKANDYDDDEIEFDLTLKEGSTGFFSFRSEDSSKVPWDAYAMDYLQIGGEAIFVVNRYHNGTEWTTETAGVAFNFADGQSHHIKLEMDNEAKIITLTVDGTTTTTLTCSGSWRTTGGMSIVGNQTGLELKNLKLAAKTPWTTADSTNVTIDGDDVTIAQVAGAQPYAYTKTNDYDDTKIEFDIKLTGEPAFFTFRAEDSTGVAWGPTVLDYLQITNGGATVVHRYHNGTEWVSQAGDGVAVNFADGQSHHILVEIDDTNKKINLTVDGDTAQTKTLTVTEGWRTTGGMSIMGNGTGVEFKNLTLGTYTPPMETIWTATDNVTLNGDDVTIAQVAGAQPYAYTKTNDYDDTKIEFDIKLTGEPAFFTFRAEDSTGVAWGPTALDYLQITNGGATVVHRYHNGTEWVSQAGDGVAVNFADGQSHHILIEIDDTNKKINLTVDGDTAQTKTLTVTEGWRTTGGMSIMGNGTGVEFKNLTLGTYVPPVESIWKTNVSTGVTLNDTNIDITAGNTSIANVHTAKDTYTTNSISYIFKVEDFPTSRSDWAHLLGFRRSDTNTAPWGATEDAFYVLIQNTGCYLIAEGVGQDTISGSFLDGEEHKLQLYIDETTKKVTVVIDENKNYMMELIIPSLPTSGGFQFMNRGDVGSSLTLTNINLNAGDLIAKDIPKTYVDPYWITSEPEDVTIEDMDLTFTKTEYSLPAAYTPENFYEHTNFRFTINLSNMGNANGSNPGNFIFSLLSSEPYVSSWEGPETVYIEFRQDGTFLSHRIVNDNGTTSTEVAGYLPSISDGKDHDIQVSINKALNTVTLVIDKQKILTAELACISLPEKGGFRFQSLFADAKITGFTYEAGALEIEGDEEEDDIVDDYDGYNTGGYGDTGVEIVVRKHGNNSANTGESDRAVWYVVLIFFSVATVVTLVGYNRKRRRNEG